MRHVALIAIVITASQPEILEHKFYAKGVGPVLAMAISSGSDREELLSRS